MSDRFVSNLYLYYCLVCLPLQDKEGFDVTYITEQRVMLINRLQCDSVPLAHSSLFTVWLPSPAVSAAIIVSSLLVLPRKNVKKAAAAHPDEMIGTLTHQPALINC